MPDGQSTTRITNYRPEIPNRAWDQIGPFVRTLVEECVDYVSYDVPDLMYAISRHVWWCIDTAGLELDRRMLFRRDVIAVSVEAMCGSSPASKGNRRSQLFRVAEHLRTIAREAPVPAFPNASAHAPYSSEDVGRLRNWAAGQRTDLGRANAWTLLLLGIGAGLRAGEICSTTHKQLIDTPNGHTIVVADGTSRTVPLLSEWEEHWAELPERHDGHVFRPGVSGHYPNMVTNFVHRSSGAGLKPQTQRLRATWLVNQLNAGTPLGVLMTAAGLTSAASFSRLLPFLTNPTSRIEEDLLRRPSLLSLSRTLTPGAEQGVIRD
jgi:integrase